MNALDHVADPDRALRELARVTAPGGIVLLLVEVGHGPTVTEPHTISWDVADALSPAFTPELVRRIEKSCPGIYESVLCGRPAERDRDRFGILCARLRRTR
jgi:ubiquinone/menaquinone biosynthesis C-methylase UbiE